MDPMPTGDAGLSLGHDTLPITFARPHRLVGFVGVCGWVSALATRSLLGIWMGDIDGR